MFEKTENKRKRGRGWPILKKSIFITKCPTEKTLNFAFVWSTLVEYWPPGKLTLELVLSQQKQKAFIFMDYAAYQVGH